VPATELQATLNQRRETLRSLRSEASIAVMSPERSAKATQLLIVERPDRLRVEVLSPPGVVFALASANGDLAAWVRDENRVYRGAATPGNLARYAGIDLQITDAVDILLGGPPRRTVREASVDAEPETGRVRLRQETDSGAQIVFFAGEPLLPVEVQEIGGGGDLLWRAHFDAYQSVGGFALATRIGVDVPGTGQSILVALRDAELNPSLPASVFVLPTPAGSSEVQL